MRGTIRIGEADVPFGPDLLFAATDMPGFVLHVEICEDMFVPVPPSAEAALAGATVLANLSGSPITIGRAEDRELLARSASSRCLAAYVYAAAGEGESTTDLAWDGQTMIWENGVCWPSPSDSPRGSAGRSPTSTSNCCAPSGCGWAPSTTTASTIGSPTRVVPARRVPARPAVGRHRAAAARSSGSRSCPRIPHGWNRTATRPTTSRSSGLEQRLRALGYPKVVIGVSGGLDSTHALIVAARAMDREKRPRSDILAFTLPGFATGERTKGNATRLAEALGVTFENIDIKPTAELMLKEMGHPFSRGEKVYDVTFENVQAGLRTDYLFRLANQRGGIVLGTGDLSELALGWSTYGVGDQMSHYNVNGGVPKTLIQHLIRWVISSHQFDDTVNEVLQSVLDTEITPELVPTGRGRGDPEQRGQGRPVRAAGLFAVPGAALRLPAVEGRVPGVACVERRRARRLAARLPRGQAAVVLAAGDPALAAGVRAAVLLVQPVQAVGDAQRAEGVARRLAVAARRLAGAVGHVGAHLARRDRTRDPRGLAIVRAGPRSSPEPIEPKAAPTSTRWSTTTIDRSSLLR